MKIAQEEVFRPIPIVLETEEQARASWAAVNNVRPEDQTHRRIISELNEWLHAGGCQ